MMRKKVDKYFEQQDLQALDGESPAAKTVRRYLNRFEQVDQPGIDLSPTYFRNIFETATTYRNHAKDLGLENELTERIGENYKDLVCTYASERPEDFINSVLEMGEKGLETASKESLKIGMPQYSTLEQGVEVELKVNHGVNLKLIPNEDDGVRHLKNLMAKPIHETFDEVLRPENSDRRLSEKRTSPSVINLTKL